MPYAIPIPAEIWQQIRSFLRANRSGQIVLTVKPGRTHGHVCDALITQRFTTKDAPEAAWLADVTQP